MTQMQRKQVARAQPAANAAAEEAKRQESLRAERQRVASSKQKLSARLEHALTHSGYLPPAPPPLVRSRALHGLAQEVDASGDVRDSAALGELAKDVEAEAAASYQFLHELRTGLEAGTSVIARLKAIAGRIDRVIDQTIVSVDIPDASAALETRMRRYERFMATDWVLNEKRGMLAVHVDHETNRTILQIGMAEHGPVYITIKRVLQPDDVALNSIRELLTRMAPFSDITDPIAIIDGHYQTLNYTELFRTSNVLRVPSGDLSRLAANMATAYERERLDPDNTVIVNSAPRSLEQYRSVFPTDRRAIGWGLWSEEPAQWDDVAGRTNFSTAPEASRESLLAALTQSQNVIVLVAHCDGETLFMPEPEPEGTAVTAEYLLEHRDAISANAPFVYLFACEAGNVANQRNFVSTLLDCGACGVVASQTLIGTAEGRTMLTRLLNEARGAPPVMDALDAMREIDYFEMEVFLA